MKLTYQLYQRGLTLFEALLVMFVGAIVIGGVIVLYNTVQTSVKTSNLISGIQQIAAGIHNTFISSGVYSTLNTTLAQSLAPTGAVPDWAQGYTPYWTSTYASVYTAGVNSASPNSFYISVGPIPTQACANLVSAALAGGAVFACGGTAGVTTCAITDPGLAAAGCTSPTASYATLIYN